MDNSLWNTKLKVLYETLPTAEKELLVNFIEDFVKLPETSAMSTIRDMIVNPTSLSIRYGLAEDYLIKSRSSLVNIYKTTYPNCWLNNKKDINKKILETFCDYTFSLYVDEIISSTLKKSSLDIERIIFLLKLPEEKNIYGGLVSMNFTKIEANYLKTFNNLIVEVLEKEYNAIKAFITPDTTVKNTPDAESKSTNCIFKIEKHTSLTKNTIRKVDIWKNRDVILKFYSIIQEVNSTPLNVSALLEKENIILPLIEEETI